MGEKLVREKYVLELESLKDDLRNMCKEVVNALTLSMEAIKNKNREMAREVIEGDEKIDNLFMDFQEKVIRLIAQQQPVAIDLRFIEASMNAAMNLERIADYAVDIAKTLEYVKEPEKIFEVDELFQMYEIGKNMVLISVEALVEKNMEKVESVYEAEKEMDKLYTRLFDVLPVIVKGETAFTFIALKLLLIGKFLERIGDRAVNISNRIHYWITGERKFLR